ncbi:hypothetical protein F5146DRAFT_1145743 [Armillaria mellea]|nr:hypothetical protein F5146DRAFT_1145743 [Armillaria mellea]
MSAELAKSYGAVAIGALCASLLSGAVAIQTILYYKFYPSDFPRVKLLVSLQGLRHMVRVVRFSGLSPSPAYDYRFLDICHTTFIWISIWDCFITHFGDFGRTDVIPWSIAVTVVETALLTFLVHCFFAHRIFMLSRRNWLITCPILIAATLRLGSACGILNHFYSRDVALTWHLSSFNLFVDNYIATGRIRLKTYSGFIEKFGWVFTLGLSMSSVADILITVSLLALLHKSRTDAESINAIIDSLILYTFETGSLTCAGTIVDMACWVSMKSNLIFLGIHFVIGKLYANSLLVTLNMRRGLRRGQTIYFSRNLEDGNGLVLNSRRRSHLSEPEFTKATELQINVEQSVHYKTDVDLKMETGHTTGDGSESVAE